MKRIMYLESIASKKDTLYIETWALLIMLVIKNCFVKKKKELFYDRKLCVSCLMIRIRTSSTACLRVLFKIMHAQRSILGKHYYIIAYHTYNYVYTCIVNRNILK